MFVPTRLRKFASNCNPMENSANKRVEHALEALRSGNGVLLMDDITRENEGDLIFSTAHLTKEQVALMIRHCSGIICLCITQQKADQLNLLPMVAANNSRFGTPFTVSIEAKEGVTTGISAADRLQTIVTAAAQNAQPDDLARPGHVFPLVAHHGGITERRGHTEGSIELMRLAGLAPSAVLCELMNDDGSVAKLPEIESFAEKHGIPVLSIQDLVSYLSTIEAYA